MATRPTVGGSDGTWGTELNAHLDVSLDADGKVDDGAAQTTSAAPGADAELANKKYIDDQIAAAIASEVTLSAFTDEDSESNAMLKAHAYLAATAGEVSAFASLTTVGHAIVGYVGSTNDPVGAGTKFIQQTMETNTDAIKGIFFTVAEGEYFEVTTTSGTPTILWRSRGTLSKPVDQD